MMTYEEKVAWAENADTEKLLKEYERNTVYADDAFKWASFYNVDVKIIYENYHIVRNEVVKRMTVK